MRENIEQELTQVSQKARNARTKFENLDKPKQGQKAAFAALQDSVAKAVEEIEAKRQEFLETL